MTMEVQIQRYPARQKPFDQPKKRKNVGASSSNVNATAPSGTALSSGASARPLSNNSNKRGRLL